MKTTNKEASDAVTRVMSSLSFLVTALGDDVTLDAEQVQGLAAILADLKESLDDPANHLHGLVLIDIHGPNVHGALAAQRTGGA